MRVSLILIGITVPLAISVLSGTSMAAAGDSSYVRRGLSASTAPPWNPPEARRATVSLNEQEGEVVPAAKPWERVMRLPGQVVSLPLTALNRVAEKSLIYAEQADVLARAMLLFAREGALGISVAPSSLGDRAGFGGEALWQPRPLGRHLSVDAATTLNQYNREHVTARAGPLRAIYTSEWRSREPYFGPGLGAPRSGLSAYSAQLQSAKLLASWPASVEGPAALPGLQSLLLAGGPVHFTQVSAWAGPSESVVSNGRDPHRPSFELAHPVEAAGSIDRHLEHFAYGAGISHDARSGVPHWSRGWRASVEAERHDKSIEALALRDAHSGARSFSRVTYRAEAGASFGRDPRTLRLAVTTVDQRLDDGGGIFSIRDQASLGGNTGLAGFEPGRFHDIDLIVAKLSYIYPLVKNLEFDLHTEAGGVYPNLGSARISSLENSFGAALRFRGDLAPFAMVGLDWSSESVRFRFSIGGVD
jgi:hypothetical protein